MATRASLKALTAAFESLNNNNVITGGQLRATELNTILSGIASTLDAVVDAIFDNDQVSRITGTFSSATTLQDDSLIGASLDDLQLFVDGDEFITRGYIDSLNGTTGTLTFIQSISGKYKLYNFYNA